MDQMPSRRGNGNKRCSAGSDDDLEVPESKKQINSYENGGPANSKKWGHKNKSVNENEEIKEIHALHRKLVRREEEDAFPRFRHGTVYVQLIEMDPKYTYIFDKDIIARCSDKLEPFIRPLAQATEADRGLADTIKSRTSLEFYFDLRYIPKIGIWAITRRVSTSSTRSSSPPSLLVRCSANINFLSLLHSSSLPRKKNCKVSPQSNQ